MRALTIRQPWCYAITHLGKRVENRTTRPPSALVGVRIAIHAGLAFDDTAPGWIVNHFGHQWRSVPGVFREMIEAPRGPIVATARIGGWFSEKNADEDEWEPTDLNHESVLRSPWYVGPVGILLADVVVLATPVPCRGAQGYWTVPAEIEELLG